MKKLLSFFFFVSAFAVFATHAQAQALVIANPSVKVSDASKGDLRDVFSGASSSLGGSHVAPALLKGGPANEAFLREIIGKSDAAFRASWRGLVFSGQGSMPKSVDSDAAMVDFVAHNPGAIGYIGKASPHDGVKVISVK